MAKKGGNKKSGNKQATPAPAAGTGSSTPVSLQAPARTPARTPAPPSKAVVGINFGESVSSIALINKEGLADTIANDDGERQVATAISFLGGQQYVGNPARGQLVRNQKNVIFGFRNLLGKTYAEAKDIKRPFDSAAIVDANGEPGFSVDVEEDGKPSVLPVSEVARRFLKTLIGYAQDFYGRPVTHAVVAIPSEFAESQQAAVIKAVQAAGVENVALISDTAAALMGYETDETKSENQNCLVVDVGATATKVALVEQRLGLFVPLSEESVTDGSASGLALDKALTDFFAKEFTKKTKVSIKPEDHRANVKMYLASDIVKRSLSASTTAQCSIESLSDGYDFNSPVNRTRLAVVGSPVVEKISDIVSNVLNKAQVNAASIDTVAFVGATTNLDVVTSRILGLLSENAYALPGLPENVISLGAARQADLLFGAFTETPLHKETITSIAKYLTNTASFASSKALSQSIGITVPAADAPGLVPVKDNADLSFYTLLGKDTPLPAQSNLDFPEPLKEASVLSVYEASDVIVPIQPEPAAPLEGEDDLDDLEDDEEDIPEDPIDTRFTLLGTQLATFVVPAGSSRVAIDVGSKNIIRAFAPDGSQTSELAL